MLDAAASESRTPARKLLTIENPKTMKSRTAGYMTAVLHLAPTSLSGRNVCPHSTAGCRESCLNTAGRGGWGIRKVGDLNMVQRGRIRRTHLFQQDRPTFMAQLVKEIAAFERKARKLGLRPAARPNGTSDLPWERFPVIRDGVEYPHIFAAFPDIQFYDYTKWPISLRRRALDVPNYSLTFSLAETNDDRALAALAMGVNVAVVFDAVPAIGYKTEPDPLPGRFMGHRVIDGDESDLRFLDPASVIVGLRAKGRARKDRSGFVRSVD